MRVNKKSIIKIYYIDLIILSSILYGALSLFYANGALTTVTTKTIQGSKPAFAKIVEDNISDLELLGVQFTDINGGSQQNINYYGDDEIRQIPVRSAYPFAALFKVAPPKQPDASQYYSADGDDFKELIQKNVLTLEWYYTSSTGSDVAFTPSKTDTFCSLTSAGRSGPYKVKISGDLIIRSIYGDPRENEYPNAQITNQPSKMYTVLDDAGICWAQPALSPDKALYTGSQWQAKKGFLTQSAANVGLNFPKTAFYKAKFDLLLAKNGLASNYNWDVEKGREMVSIRSNSNTVTVTFDGTSAGNTASARSLVVSNGYEVIIKGTHKTNGAVIRYPFKIERWYSGWNGTIAPTSSSRATEEGEKIPSACNALSPKGGYRMTYGNEVSNAELGVNAEGESAFTREIAPLIFSEWGNIDASSYPDSFGYDSNSARRFWVLHENTNALCDIHLYNGKYHCRSNERENKNAVCLAIP